MSIPLDAFRLANEAGSIADMFGSSKAAVDSVAKLRRPRPVAETHKCRMIHRSKCRLAAVRVLIRRPRVAARRKQQTAAARDAARAAAGVVAAAAAGVAAVSPPKRAKRCSIRSTPTTHCRSKLPI